MGAVAPQQKKDVSPNVKMKMNAEEGPGEDDDTEELVESWLQAFAVNKRLNQRQEKQSNFFFPPLILASCAAAELFRSRCNNLRRLIIDHNKHLSFELMYCQEETHQSPASFKHFITQHAVSFLRQARFKALMINVTVSIS